MDPYFMDNDEEISGEISWSMLTSLQAYLSLSPPAPKVLENMFVTRGLHWGIRFATSKSMAT